MTSAIELEFEVACSIDHAFEMWARKTRCSSGSRLVVSGICGTSVVSERPGPG